MRIIYIPSTRSARQPNGLPASQLSSQWMPRGSRGKCESQVAHRRESESLNRLFSLFPRVRATWQEERARERQSLSFFSPLRVSFARSLSWKGEGDSFSMHLLGKGASAQLFLTHTRTRTRCAKSILVLGGPPRESLHHCRKQPARFREHLSYQIHTKHIGQDTDGHARTISFSRGRKYQ